MAPAIKVTEQGPNGWASYKVADGRTKHEAWGWDNVRFHHMITVSLDDKGEISNVINDTVGAATAATKTKPRVIRKVTAYP